MLNSNRILKRTIFQLGAWDKETDRKQFCIMSSTSRHSSYKRNSGSVITQTELHPAGMGLIPTITAYSMVAYSSAQTGQTMQGTGGPWGRRPPLQAHSLYLPCQPTVPWKPLADSTTGSQQERHPAKTANILRANSRVWHFKSRSAWHWITVYLHHTND